MMPDENNSLDSDDKDLNPKKGITREIATIDEPVSENPQKQETNRRCAENRDEYQERFTCFQTRRDRI